MRRIVRNPFKELGLPNVDEAEDGAIVPQKSRPVVSRNLSSDWNMPKYGWPYPAPDHRSTLNLKHLPVLMITAEAKKETSSRLLRWVPVVTSQLFTIGTCCRKTDQHLFPKRWVRAERGPSSDCQQRFRRTRSVFDSIAADAGSPSPGCATPVLGTRPNSQPARAILIWGQRRPTSAVRQCFKRIFSSGRGSVRSCIESPAADAGPVGRNTRR